MPDEWGGEMLLLLCGRGDMFAVEVLMLGGEWAEEGSSSLFRSSWWWWWWCWCCCCCWWGCWWCSMGSLGGLVWDNGPVSSTRPLTFSASATLSNAANWSWATFTSPRYMYSRIAFISEYFTSFSTTTGCLQGSSVKRDWKYDEHAASTILWHLTEVPPSQARVTSVNASLRRSSSNTASRLVRWLFHLRQYCCVVLPILLLVKGAVPKRLDFLQKWPTAVIPAVCCNSATQCWGSCVWNQASTATVSESHAH